MSVPREDPTKCQKGLHDWTPENTYLVPSTGKTCCRGCEKDRKAAIKEGTHQPHPQKSGHCRKGHEYTLENTIKVAKMINGKKQIERSCRRCAADYKRTRR